MEFVNIHNIDILSPLTRVRIIIYTIKAIFKVNIA